MSEVKFTGRTESEDTGGSFEVTAPLTYTGPERRKTGRPTNPEFLDGKEKLNLWVGLALFDRVCRIAVKADIPVQVVGRMALEHGLDQAEAMLLQRDVVG
jgi:hypothetical protein